MRAGYFNAQRAHFGGNCHENVRSVVMLQPTIAFSHVSAIPFGQPKLLGRHMVSAFFITFEHSAAQAIYRRNHFDTG